MSILAFIVFVGMGASTASASSLASVRYFCQSRSSGDSQGLMIETSWPGDQGDLKVMQIGSGYRYIFGELRDADGPPVEGANGYNKKVGFKWQDFMIEGQDFYHSGVVTLLKYDNDDDLYLFNSDIRCVRVEEKSK